MIVFNQNSFVNYSLPAKDEISKFSTYIVLLKTFNAY